MIRFLPRALILAIHDDQIRLYGGSYGVRDEGALDSAIHMPQVQFGGSFLHSSIYHMAAAYGFHLSQNHPFLDANKRTAGMAMFTFLRLNGLGPGAAEADYYHTMIAMASGQLTKDQLADWLRTIVTGTPPEVR